MEEGRRLKTYWPNVKEDSQGRLEVTKVEVFVVVVVDERKTERKKKWRV